MPGRVVLLLAAAIFLCSCKHEEKKPVVQNTVDESDTPEVDSDRAKAMVDAILKGTDAAFVFYDVSDNVYIRYNQERVDTQFSPFSTFKIPNTLIALETGAATGTDMVMDWDPKKYPREPFWGDLKKRGLEWDKSHSLKTAFQNSVVWYYQELAQQVGPEKMKQYLAQFSYGNQDISSGVSRFWLNGSLQVSAEEQVSFLKHFVQKTLGLSEKTYAAGFEVFEEENQGTATLYAKTGGGENIGWYVGFVQKDGKFFLFAFNMPGSIDQTAGKRVALTKEILKKLGVWG